MRSSRRLQEPRLHASGPISARRRRELRWIFAAIFAANSAATPVAGRAIPFAAPVAGAFEVTHRTESSSEGEDAPNDIALILEFAPNVTSGAISTTLSTSTCTAPFDLQLSDRTVSTSVTCEAGTVLTTGANVVVMGAGGDLTLRAGQSVEMEDGLEVESGGVFTAEIDGLLEP